MKLSFERKYYFRLFINIILSTIIFLVITLFLIYNFVTLNASHNVSIINNNNNSILNENYVGIFFCLLFGVVVFTITFILLERKRTKSIIDIYKAIERITDGDFTNEIKIDNSDEFSMIADNINIMQVRIVELIQSERESEKSKNELITNIAHDLRTPLTSILGYLEILETNPRLSDEQRKNYLNIAYEKSKKLGSLIEDLFSYTKLSVGSLNVNLDEFDIVKLLSQLLDEMYPLFEKESLNYEFVSNVNEMIVCADSKLIARLFENLINNAIKYGKDGKKIILRFNQLNNDVYEVYVLNYGEIIPRDALTKLFDRFYRVDKSRNSKIAGTGLGLAIAKNIVELHNGKIEVKSDVNGTEFKVTLNRMIKNKSNEKQ